MATFGTENKPYIANQPYNQSDIYHPPSTILEPAEFDDENGVLLLTYRPLQLFDSSFGNPKFLRDLSSIKPGPVSCSVNKFGWKYSSRHEAQLILPFLYLGPAPVARSASYLSQTGITMVIAVRSAQSARARPRLLDPSRFPSCAGLQTANFDVDGPLDLLARIKPMLKLMTDHLEQQTAERSVKSFDDVKGKILVFCESGNERSPVLIAAYLMLVYGITWHESLNLIHAFRFSVGLNGSMNDMLKTFEGMLRAESDTATARQPTSPKSSQDKYEVTSTRSKRSIDDAYGSDDEVMEDVEAESPLRPGIAPFVDR